MNQKKIVIINYGMGNIGSMAEAISYLGGNYFVSDKKEDIEKADGLILPGVGAFAAAMDNLKSFNLLETLKEQVIVKKKPFLGVCLGMQLLAEDSVEQGFHQGLGYIKGHVVEIKPEGGLRVPHVGWNDVQFTPGNFFFQRVDEGAHFYFDHSYHLQCDDNLVVAAYDYGGKGVAAIRKDNIFATQFHPEKSQRNGLKILRNFLNFVANTNK